MLYTTFLYYLILIHILKYNFIIENEKEQVWGTCSFSYIGDV